MKTIKMAFAVSVVVTLTAALLPMSVAAQKKGKKTTSAPKSGKRIRLVTREVSLGKVPPDVDVWKPD